MTEEARTELAAVESEVAEPEQVTPRSVEYSGRTFLLPESLGLQFSVLMADVYEASQEEQAADERGDTAAQLDALNRGNLAGIKQLRLLFGDQFAELAAMDPSKEDLQALVKQALLQYGAEQGESSASAAPSGITGEQSRPTSSGTTA